ncbi:MAG: triose-phosphate isomerase [Rhodomicrobium sp.]|nr:triose-phosphate isomerase [Rhodomicrobium sp.]
MNGSKLLVAGNWKMNGVHADLAQIEAIKASAGSPGAVNIALFPPATLIRAAASVTAGSSIEVGAQDCHAENSGAFTGDLSAPILKDAGASAVIVGHSERRSGHGETSRDVRAKAAAALRAGLNVIVCLGETKGERAAGLASAVCARQLSESLPEESKPENTIIAYEPVWAIGTGVSPTSAEIGTIHELLRAQLNKRTLPSGGQRWRILYGGSVSPANAAAIFEGPEVDGALVGGASLNASSFLAIIAAATEAAKRRVP